MGIVINLKFVSFYVLLILEGEKYFLMKLGWEVAAEVQDKNVFLKIV